MLTRSVFNRDAMKTVGERIRQAREYRGLTGEELAERVGYKTQSGIGNLENRATGRGGFRLPRIAEVLGFPLDWFLNGPDVDDLRELARNAHQVVQEERRPYSRQERAVAILQNLNDTGIEKAIDYLEMLEAKYNRHSTSGAGDPIPAQRRHS